METTVLPMLIKLTLTGAVMVLVVLLLRFIFKRFLPKNFIIYLWVVAFAAFVIPVSLPAPAFIGELYNGFSQTVHSGGAPIVQAVPQNLIPNMNGMYHQPKNQQDTTKDKSKMLTFEAVLVIIYGSVSLALIVIFSILYFITLVRLKKSSPVQDDEQYKSLREVVGVRKVKLAKSQNVCIPVTAGIIRPKIVLPEGFDLNNRQMVKHIYVHELNHVKRCDNGISMGALLITCLHWFNPFCWVAYYLLCCDLELACDSRTIRVIGYRERAEYAKSLLSVADKKRKMQPMFVTAFGKYDMKERVTNIMNTKRISAKALSLCIVSVVIVVTAFLVASCTKENPIVPSPDSADASSSDGSSIDKAISSTEENAKNAAAKNMMTEENKKMFGEIAFNYWFNIGSDFNGEITTKDMGNGIFLYCINNGGITLDGFPEKEEYIIPEEVGDKMIQERFNVKMIDHSKIDFYDAQKKTYVLSINDLGQGGSIGTVIDSIEQTGDTVVLTATYSNPDESDYYPDAAKNPENGKKLFTMRFTLNIRNDLYQYEKVETVWKAEA